MAGCKQEKAENPPPPRPVRTTVVQTGGLGETILLTGQIQAREGSRARLSHRRPHDRARGRRRRSRHAGPDRRKARSAERVERAALRARGAVGRQGTARTGFQQFRPAGDAAAAGLDDARQFRSGAAGQAHRAGLRRRREGAGRDRRGPRDLHRTQGRRERHDHAPRRQIRRSGAGCCS